MIVAVQDGDCILKTKPHANVLYSTNQRVDLVKALRIVDEVIVYQDVDLILPQVDFDVFAKGPDQNHAGFMRAIDWCEKNKKDVITLPRTDGISSTDIKKQLEELQ